MFRAKPRGLLDFLAACLCLWAAAWHTPAGALLRGLAGKLTGRLATTRPLLAYFSGGVYDAHEVRLPTVAEVPAEVAVAPPGAALGRGVFVVLGQQPAAVRASAQQLASHYQLPAPHSPDALAALVNRARVDFETDEGAVFALFAGQDIARYVIARARAEGERPTLEVISRQLPPGASGLLRPTSQALMFGQAYSLSWPVSPSTRVTSPFGTRTHPTLGTQHLHTGVDLSVPEGTDVRVVAAGRVIRASEDAVNGKVVVIDHGRGVSTAYCHNSRLLVTVGEMLQAGQVISRSGNTGRSTGPHLHYQLELGRRPIDPFRFRGTLAAKLPADSSSEEKTGKSTP